MLYVRSVVCAILLSFPVLAHADDEAWVEYQESTNTLTFRYDDQRESAEATGKYTIPPTAQNLPQWSGASSKISKLIKKVVFADSFADARPTCCYAWFSEMSNLTAIEGIGNLNTSEVIEMDAMFSGCSSLTSIDLSHFDTHNVDGMWRMFQNCTSLTSVDISNFNTDNLNSMSNMFEGCTNLSSIALPSLENPKLQSLGRMFRECLSLKEIDFTGFKTPSVTTMVRMFEGCSSLTTVDLRSFDTSNLTEMSYMFGGCTKLKEAELTSFDTSSVKYASAMFSGCSSLQSLYVSDKFALSDSCTSEDMFSGCVKLPGYDSSKVDKSMANSSNGYLTKIESGSQTWVEYDETSQTLTFHYDASYTEGDNHYEIPEDMSNSPEWLEHNKDIVKVVFDRAFSYARPTCCYGWFAGLEKLSAIEGMEYLNTSDVEDMSWMFHSCESLTTLNLSRFNTASVTCMDKMFFDCSSLSTIYVGKSFVLSEECTGNQMFLGCSNLEGYSNDKSGKEMANYDTGYFSLYLAQAEPWAAYDAMANTLTFYYNGEREYSDATMTCLYNIAADEDSYVYPGWYDYAGAITKVVFDKSFADYRPQSCMGLFASMEKLTDIEGLENLNVSEVKNMYGMFIGCGVASLDLSNFDTSSVENMCAMFHSCANLKTVDLSNWNTSKVTDMSKMFGYCLDMTSIDLSDFNFSAAKDLSGMFENCSALKSIGLPQSSTSNVTDMSEMFRGCQQIEELDLSWFTTDTLDATTQMFYGCSALKNIYVNDKFVLSEDCSGALMFRACTLLPNYDADNCGEEKANYTDGCLTLRRHFAVGHKLYNADGVDAVCRSNVVFGDKEAFSSAFDFTFGTANTASYNRAVSSNWATLCLPFSFDAASGEGVTCYKISEIGTDRITVDQIQENVAAGEPVLVYTATGNISISSNAGANVVKEPVTSTYMAGTFRETEVENDAKNYIISKDKFWNVPSLLGKSGAKAIKMSPYRAYIADPTSSANSVSLDISTGETDGIGNVNAADALQFLDGAELYDVQGHRLATPCKGLVIAKKGGMTRKLVIR